MSYRAAVDRSAELQSRAMFKFSDVRGIGSAEPPEDVYVPIPSGISDGRNDAAVLDRSMLDAQVAVVTSSDFVDLSWPSISGVAGYRIFKDDVLLGTTSTPSLRDSEVLAGESYYYRIEVVLDDATEPDVSEEIQRLGVIAHTPQAGVQSEVAARELNAGMQQRAANASAWVRLRTFIPESRVDAPSQGCQYGPGYQFGGDGRSWSVGAGTARISLTANLRFDNNDPRMVGSSKSIGSTNVYRKATGALVSTRTESGDRVSVKELAGSPSQVDLRYSVSAGNPYCSIGAISGAFTMNVYKNGNWAIRSGSHRQMPNWEIYAGWVGGPDRKVYQRRYASKYCLVNGACPEAQMGGHTGRL